MHTHVGKDMCLGPLRGTRSHRRTQNKHVYIHRSTSSSQAASQGSLQPDVSPPPTRCTSVPLTLPQPHTCWPLPTCLPWLEHLAKLLLQFLLKTFQSFLRRFFVSLKTFLIFSSNWRGVSWNVRTQAWKESRAPLMRISTGPMSVASLSHSLGLSHIRLLFLLFSPCPLPLFVGPLCPEVVRFIIYSWLHLAHSYVPGIW